MSSANDANITAVLGATGSGKSAWLKQKLRRERPRRLMIWDPKREYSAFGMNVLTTAALVDQVTRAGRSAPGAFVFAPSTDGKVRAGQFNIFCALALGDHDKPEQHKTYGGNLSIVVEEMHLVTRASWAPSAWSAVTLMGRSEGLTVYGLSPRPSSMNKDFLYEATTTHVGMLAGEDIITVAGTSRIPAARIRELKKLEWLELDAGSTDLRAGRVRF